MKKIIRIFTALILTTIVFLGSFNSTKPLKAEESFTFPGVAAYIMNLPGEAGLIKDNSIFLKIEEVDESNKPIPGGYTEVASNNRVEIVFKNVINITSSDIGRTYRYKISLDHITDDNATVENVDKYFTIKYLGDNKFETSGVIGGNNVQFTIQNGDFYDFVKNATVYYGDINFKNTSTTENKPAAPAQPQQKPVAPAVPARTCQDDGFPAGYYWSDSAQACITDQPAAPAQPQQKPAAPNTNKPAPTATPKPTATPTAAPTATPTPTVDPTAAPTATPTATPSAAPSATPVAEAPTNSGFPVVYIVVGSVAGLGIIWLILKKLFFSSK